MRLLVVPAPTEVCSQNKNKNSIPVQEFQRLVSEAPEKEGGGGGGGTTLLNTNKNEVRNNKSRANFY